MSLHSPATLAVSVVAPAYLNAATLRALVERIETALAAAPSAEILIVDDASPDHTREVLTRLAAGRPGFGALGLAVNVGQQRAILEGLARCRGEALVVLDADLQDPPEAIPALLAALGDAPAVFAGRRGRYESLPRHVSSWGFKTLLAAIAGVPRDAGLFFAIRREVAASLVDRAGGHPGLVPLIGALAKGAPSVAVVRDRRPSGRSAYRGAMRWRTAARTLAVALRLRLRGAAELRRAAPPAGAPPIAYRLGWLAGEGPAP
jgi:glycosyltransferase involved in cell wall biosynthesis